ncbi:MAG: hypothetical protein ACFE9X_16385 [Promethearchaeota archaeon]
MTQTVKKEDFEAYDISDYYNKFYKNKGKIKQTVLNYLFRNISFVSKHENVRAITVSEYGQISKAINIPKVLVHNYISKFLVNLIYFKQFLNKHPITLGLKEQARENNVYLHKFYHLAPVFDYRRAEENSKILKIKLNQLFFWPRIMTQIAIIIFVTDLFDKSQPQKIIQANLRSLCNCSAYAFHRTRNKIGLTTKFIKSL